MSDQSAREQRGQTVRETWITWAKRQRAPKRSWLTPWDDLDDGQREVDMLIGDAVAAAERERCAALADIWEATYPVDCHASWCAGNGKHGVHRLPLGAMIRELGGETAPCETAHVLHLGGSPDGN